jgi:hypothetical protein
MMGQNEEKVALRLAGTTIAVAARILSFLSYMHLLRHDYDDSQRG